MIFRLKYCNDFGDTAMIDIETKTGVGVQEIEGSGNPFSLQYKTEKSDKSGRFMTSSADIEIYENEFFNIDILKTSNETDIKVSYYVNEVLEWQGFILPDFFSKEIKDNAVISMTATDRVSTLKSVTLDNLDETVRLRDVAKLCLDKTGLILPLLTLADFINDEGSNLFNTYIQSQRLNDEKGRSISCYDILESILIISNAQLVQRKGVWQIVNKYQLEQGVGKNYNSPRVFENWSKTLHNFEFIGKGAIRTITPVASSVGVFQEYGGSRRYPDNYDFSETGGWIAKNGFTFTRENREILKFENETAFAYTPVFGSATNNYYILNKNHLDFYGEDFLNTQPYLESQKVQIVLDQQKADIDIEINATAPEAFLIEGGLNTIGSSVNYAIIAQREEETLVLNDSGKFVPISDDRKNLHRLVFPSNNIALGDVVALNQNKIVKGTLELETGLVSDFSITIRIYGIPNAAAPTAINFAKFTIKSDQEVAKGTLYKTTQGTDFTREHDIETSIFGDYLTKGLNGYFYDYQSDDTSSLIKSNNDKTNLWTAPNETESLPLLQQISRQKARQFSIAHDIVRGDIKMGSFDPLTIFKDCNNYEYVVVSATFDFLRSIASVEVEQILYDSNISRRDYIYSYFGEGESSIKSVGGVSGGAGGGGSSGINAPTYWKLVTEDSEGSPLEEPYILTKYTAVSERGLSALGLGAGGDGDGGGSIDKLDSWANYTTAKANYYVPSSLLVPFRNDTIAQITGLQGALNSKQNTLIAGANITISGNTISSSGGISSVAWGDITGKPTTLSGYGITDAVTLNTTQTITGAKTFSKLLTANAGISTTTITASGIITAKEGNSTNWNKAYADSHTHTNKAQLDVINQNLSKVSNVDFNSAIIEGNIEVGGLLNNGKSYMYDDLTMVEGDIIANDIEASSFKGTKVDFCNGFTIEPSGTELVFKFNGVTKQRMLSDGTILATSGITALSTE